MSRTYRSKHEADEFAESVKKRAQNPQEVQLKGYHIASLYCEVHEYKSALPYAESYSALKVADPRGWKLLGFVYESLKNPAKAIQCYRRSLELNDYQKELVLKVAELYCEVQYEAEKHRYWVERAEKYYPNHRIIYKIREHILRSGKNLREYEKYLRDKLHADSNDIYLNIKLIDILLETSQMREGYQHCATVGDACRFDLDSRWWQKAAVFYKTMISQKSGQPDSVLLQTMISQKSGQPDSVLLQVYSRLLLAVNSLVSLGLAKSSAPPSHNLLQIQALDKVLLQTSDFMPTVGNALQRPQGDAVVQEVKGQLFFHLATLYLKMAVVGSVSLSDVVEMAAACYLASLQVAPFSPVTELPLKTERMDGLSRRLKRLGAERLSEICHMLNGLVQKHDEDWLEACRSKFCTKQGRQRLFEQIYGIQNPDPRQSFLMMDDVFIQTNTVQIPDMVGIVFKYDKASIEGGTTNLQRLVWLGLQWDVRQDGILPDLGSFVAVTFDRLAVTTRNLDNTSVDNLCILDLESFLYASIFIARAQLRNLHQQGLAGLNIPVALLVNCYSEEQLDWYMSVYQLYSGKAKPVDLGKFRLTAKKGLEVLRCQKNHGMETQLLVELGRTFNARVEELKKESRDPNDRRERREAYQAMSVLYWEAALDHLKTMASNRAVPHPKKPMFSHVHKPIEDGTVTKLLDEGAVVIAESLFEKGQHQVALSNLAKAKTPKALFAKAVMLHVLASMETEGKPLDKISADTLKKQGDLLDQSKHTLFLTMDSIDMEPRNPLHEEVQTLLEEIEAEQATILEQIAALEANHSDVSNLSSIRHSFLGESTRSSNLRTPSRDYDSPFRESMQRDNRTLSQSQYSEQLSPDPSPRRLAAEVRALNLSHSHLLEQNNRLMTREDKLMESNAELMKQVLQLTKDLQEIKLEQARATLKQTQAPAPAPVTPAPAAPATPANQGVTGTPSHAPQATSSPQLPQQSPQHPQQPTHPLASRQTASPSVQQTPNRTLYQPHPAYHPLESGAYYQPHMVPPSPMGPGGQAWYPSAYGMPSPMPNAAYYAQHGYAIPTYDRGAAMHPGMMASTPRSTSRGPLESLYGMYSSIGASPEEKGSPEQLAALQSLKQQQQQASSATAAYNQRLLVSGAAGAASIQGTSPQKTGVEVEEKGIQGRGAGTPTSAEKPLMFKGGSITSGLPSKPHGVIPPAMFSTGSPSPSAAARPTPAAPAQPATRGFVSTPERGIENVTPPVAPGLSSFAGTPTKPLGMVDPSKVTPQAPQPQGTSDRQKLSMMAAAAVTGGGGASPALVPTAAAPQPKSQIQQFTGFAPNPTAATSKPSQTFGNFSFSSSTVKPAPSLAKPATTSSSTPSPFAGFSFSMANTASPTAPTLSTAGVFKPAAPAKTTLQPGGSPAVFGTPTLNQDARSVSPGYPGFYASPKALPGTPSQGDQTVPSAARKPGQSPLARDTASPKVVDTPKSVSFKAEVEDDDVIFISMTQPSQEQRAKAEKLMLPGCFYLYENAPPCKGCIGCIDDLDIDSLYQRGGDGKASVPVVRPKEPTPSMFGATAGGSTSFSSPSTSSPGGSLFGGGGDTGGGISFATLAANQSEGFPQPFGKKAAGKPFHFANAGAPVFGGGASRGNDENDEHGGEEDYDPHYEPIVSLPDIGNISTGEEDEEEMFRHRAKLFRFDRDLKAWKERGVGDIKILRNPKTGRARILMRRDQILKLCANHWITTDMDLKPMMASDTAWIWFAVDFSEEEAKNEQFAVKFKHVEDAKRFQEAFIEAQDLLGVNDEEEEEEEEKEEEEATPEGRTPSVAEANPELTSLLLGSSKENQASTNLRAKFANKPGSWDCDDCYSNNSAETPACLACGGPKPSATAAPSSTTKGASAGATGSSSVLGAQFGRKAGSWDCDACYSNNAAVSMACAACTAPKPGAKAAPSSITKGASATGSTSVLGAQFGRKAGSWDCDACYSNNPAESLACAACTAPKPGTHPKSSTSASAGAVGGTFSLQAGFKNGQQQPSATGFSFGAKPNGASGGLSFGGAQPSAPGSTTGGGAFKIPAGFSLSEKSSYSKAATPDSTTTDGAAASSAGAFKLPAGVSLSSSQSPASTGFAFGTKKDDTPKPKEDVPATKPPSTGFTFGAAAPSSASGATTPGGTLVTDKFTFGTHMPQFSFGGKEKATSDAGFSFGGTTPPKEGQGETKEGYPFSSALKALSSDSQSEGDASSTPSKSALSFNDMAKSQGTSFTFRMDLSAVTAKSPVKSPGGAKSPGVGCRSPKTSFSRGGRTLSGGSIDEEVEEGDDIYFEPIFQMPDDYEVKTGEEGEEVKFSHRAKLYRYDVDSKQWKERGVGDIKVLYNSEDNVYRIVMRREQVFKVCANHYVTPQIDLRPNAGSDRSWVWSAMDASEGTVQNEQLAIRFKTADTATEFKEAFDKAKEDLETGGAKEKKTDSTDSKSEAPVIRSCDPDLSSVLADAIKASAASNVASSTVQSIGGEVNPEEERDIHFQPIVKLPDNVDLVTGEEQEVAAFVGRGKLYRFDGGVRQWKERGVGDIKIMREEDKEVYRVVMRRDQIHKVCANHYITASMSLHPMSGSDRAWVWHAMDAADGEPTSEQLAIKFKDPGIAASFKEMFEEAQAKIRLRGAGDDGGKTGGEEEDKGATASSSAGDGVAKATASSQDQMQLKKENTEEEEEEEEEEEDETDDDDDEDYEDEDESEDDDDDDDDEDEVYDYNENNDEDNHESKSENAASSFMGWVRDKLDGSDGSGASTPTSTSTSSSSNNDVDPKEDRK